MRRALLVFVFTFLIVAAIYRRVPISFLRAESGWFLWTSHSGESVQQSIVRGFFVHSSAGHYTPLAFFGEFTMAKIAGTSRTFWRWRQLTAASAIGAALFGLVASLGRLLSLSRPIQYAAAASLSALIMFQPGMVDLITCPFMIMQLSWLGVSIGVLFCLSKMFSTSSRPMWPWLAVAAAYASLHFSGLGLVTIAATAAVLVWFAFTRGGAMHQPAIRACAVMLVLTLGHAVMMLQWGDTSPANGQRPDLLFALKYCLGFLYNFVVAGLLSFTLTSPPVPSAYAMAYCWPLGLLLVVLMTAGLVRHLQRSRAETNPHRDVVTMLLLFSATGFAAMMALIAGRVAHTSDAHVVLPWYLVTPRYFIPLQFLFLGPVIVALAAMARHMSRLVLIGCCAFVPAALATQLSYQKNALPFLVPGSRASHYTCWRLLVAAARECRAAGLPLPNFSMAPLTREFGEADVEAFLPLLRHDLGLPLDEKIELSPLQSYRSGGPERYRLAPSVKAFEQKLELARD
jgi:hypothetical protein